MTKKLVVVLGAVVLLVSGCPSGNGPHTQPMPTGITYTKTP